MRTCQNGHNVPDGTYCYTCEAQDGSPKNHLPAALAEKLLKEGITEEFPLPLPDDVRELLTVLAEECGETVQRCTKILRFGMRRNPWTGEHNRDLLESELGDILAIQTILNKLGAISSARIKMLASVKIAKLKVPDGRLRIAKVPEDL